MILVFSATVILISFGIGNRTGCEKPRLKIQIFALHRGLETNAFDFEIFGETFADTLRPCC